MVQCIPWHHICADNLAVAQDLQSFHKWCDCTAATQCEASYLAISHFAFRDELLTCRASFKIQQRQSLIDQTIRCIFPWHTSELFEVLVEKWAGVGDVCGLHVQELVSIIHSASLGRTHLRVSTTGWNTLAVSFLQMAICPAYYLQESLILSPPDSICKENRVHTYCTNRQIPRPPEPDLAHIRYPINPSQIFDGLLERS